MSSFKCIVCSTKIYGGGGGVDVVKCPHCESMTPTGNEKKIRKVMEKYQNHLAYPRAAAGRAIAYAAGIYDLSTHNKRIDVGSVESKIAAKYGASSSSEHTSLGVISGRSAAGVTDHRAGLVIYQVSGRNTVVGGARGQEWALIYVVFRGSRGSVQGDDNPYGAGWGRTASGQVRNVDWRSNFNSRQDVPAWSAGVRVHAGFLEIYSSVRETVHRTVESYLGKRPHASVIVTGHSLGAGLATLCAHDLECEGICHPFCFPFCSPRAGNLEFVRDFNAKIAGQTGVLWCEVDNVSFHRAFVFVQSNDPITWAGERGFKHEMSQQSAVQVADSGNTIKQAVYGGIKKTKSDTVIYYHVRNLHRASVFGMHDYNAMEKSILG
jgi:Lipase (class 3)